MKDRILTLHPAGKSGVTIERAKYDQIKSAILTSLQEVEVLGFKDLGQMVKIKLAGKFNGSISWYYTTVKLDLEARGMIERVPNKTPQLLRLQKQESRLA
ncbi:MAG: DUF6958 family protein [Candidatus Thorarchaeota archaeon]